MHFCFLILKTQFAVCAMTPPSVHYHTLFRDDDGEMNRKIHEYLRERLTSAGLSVIGIDLYYETMSNNHLQCRAGMLQTTRTLLFLRLKRLASNATELTDDVKDEITNECDAKKLGLWDSSPPGALSLQMVKTIMKDYFELERKFLEKIRPVSILLMKFLHILILAVSFGD